VQYARTHKAATPLDELVAIAIVAPDPRRRHRGGPRRSRHMTNASIAVDSAALGASNLSGIAAAPIASVGAFFATRR
jgi:hypothetical protein